MAAVETSKRVTETPIRTKTSVEIPTKTKSPARTKRDHPVIVMRVEMKNLPNIAAKMAKDMLQDQPVLADVAMTDLREMLARHRHHRLRESDRANKIQ